jgi:hypothetical protein
MVYKRCQYFLENRYYLFNSGWQCTGCQNSYIKYGVFEKEYRVPIFLNPALFYLDNRKYHATYYFYKPIIVIKT